VPVVKIDLPQASKEHKFWDKENRILFTSVAALNVADFAVTRNGLQNGARELNPVTRLFSGSTAGLAANFAGATAGNVGLSYLFHRSGHHRLERITSMINIGASTVAVTYSVTHQWILASCWTTLAFPSVFPEDLHAELHVGLRIIRGEYALVEFGSSAKNSFQQQKSLK
jgi:hypothetical protein